MKVMTEIKLDGSFMSVMAGDAVKCGLSKPSNWVSFWTQVQIFFGVIMKSHMA